MKRKGQNFIEFSFFERKSLLFIIDSVIILLAIIPILENDIYFFNKINYIDKILPYMYSIFLYAVLSLFFGFYDVNYIFRVKKIIPISFLLGSTFSLIYILTPYVVPSLNYKKVDVLIFFLKVCFGLALWRYIFARVFSRYFFRNVLLITEENYPYSEKQLKNILQGKDFSNGIKVKNTISIDDYNFNQLNRIKNIRGYYSIIILAINDYSHLKEDINEFLLECLKEDILVQSFHKSYEDIYSAIPLRIVENIFYDVFFLGRSNYNYFYKFFNKVIDYLFCLIAGLFLLTLIPIIWIINLFFNRGPLFYSQIRVGIKGKKFKIYKFRSMVINAEELGEAIMAVKNDRRVTPFGNILRKLRIDELPQIFSVLIGNMSLIGPRPERDLFVDKLINKNKFYNIRHCIKPGITGWAQINYKYGENLEDSLKKLEYDLYYIKNRSVYMDLIILFKTVNSILFSKGQ